MTSRRMRIALAAFVALVPAAANATEPVGFVAAVRGFTEMKATEGHFAMAVIDRDVAQGDVVRTSPNGWLKMLLADDTTLAVDADSELRIDGFGGREGTLVSLRTGHVRTKLVDGFGKRALLVMNTPHARIEARGTEWLTWLESEATWVCAVSGVVNVRAAERSIDLAAGDCARAAEAVQKVSRPRRLQAVAMRPGAVRDKTVFPAKPDGEPDADLTDSDPLVIDVNDLLRQRAPQDLPDGRPPASAAIP